MKKLSDFKGCEIEVLKPISGGKAELGGFVHTSFVVMGAMSVQDTFYDTNGNGTVDEDEQKSFAIAVANSN